MALGDLLKDQLGCPSHGRLGKCAILRVAVKVIDPRGNEGLRVLPEERRWA